MLVGLGMGGLILCCVEGCKENDTLLFPIFRRLFVNFFSKFFPGHEFIASKFQKNLLKFFEHGTILEVVTINWKLKSNF